MQIPFTSLVLSASALVAPTPVEVRGLLLVVSTAGQAVTLYDGKDTATGIARAYCEASNNTTVDVSFPPGFLFERGLYASLGASVKYCTIVYRPLPFHKQPVEP